ncbi:MAG TPA: methionyl-tRNA formyltransferase [Vicinamibacterales bacterium]|nr:methionyl-tRNA formyltransferase [Vicinamibacterales bacterium]
MSGLRVVFLGTPQFAVPTLQRLLASRHSVVGVVTQPDRPSGRGQKTTDAPVKACALAANVPVLQPLVLTDPAFQSALTALGADIGVVAAYGKILSETILGIPARGMINVHASVLPRYRGAAPIHRAVMNGETQSGVTIMRVVKALDAGPMLSVITCPIGPDDTSDQVERELARLGADLLVETLDRMENGQVPEVPQNDADTTYAHRLTREDGVVIWSKTASEIHDQIRGLFPWPHAFSFLNGERVILWRSTPTASDTAAEPGTVLDSPAGELHVATGHGSLSLTELQREGKRPTNARDFLSGFAARPGDRFSSQP